jgi:hypothetical protein
MTLGAAYTSMVLKYKADGLGGKAYCRGLNPGVDASLLIDVSESTGMLMLRGKTLPVTAGFNYGWLKSVASNSWDVFGFTIWLLLMIFWVVRDKEESTIDFSYLLSLVVTTDFGYIVGGGESSF